MRNVILAAILVVCLAGNVFGSGKEGLAKYQLRVDALGPVSIGLTPKEASIKLGMPFEPDTPPANEEQSCYYVSPEAYSEDIAFMVEDGRITRIDIMSRKIASLKGIRVGDLEGAVNKAFRGIVKEEPHPYLQEDGKYLIVETKPGFGFIFETMHGKITSFRSGRMSSVRYIEGCL